MQYQQQPRALGPAPFVNAEVMKRYTNGQIRIVGTLKEETPTEVMIQTSDNQIVKACLALSLFLK
jgi:Tfp pilus assembly protein PilP